MSGFQFNLIAPVDSNLVAQSTLRHCNAVTDFVYSSLAPDFFSNVELLPEALSDHLPVSFVLKGNSNERVSFSPDGLPILRFHVDFRGVDEVYLTDDGVSMATKTFQGSVNDALNAIYDFFKPCTKVRKASSKLKLNSSDMAVIQVRRQIRRAHRLQMVDYSSSRADGINILYQKLETACRNRDHEKRQSIQEKFWQAISSNSPKDMWSFFTKAMDEYDGTVRSPPMVSRISAENHFSNLYFRSNLNASVRAELLSNLPEYLHVLDCAFTLEEVQGVIVGKKNWKAAGPNGHSSTFYRLFQYDEVFVSAVVFLFDSVYQSVTLPDSWHEFFVSVLFKHKGSPFEISNYRGISLSCNLRKIFETCLSNRLMGFLESMPFFSEFQAAFRRKRSTLENVILLDEIKRESRRTGVPTYCGMIDLRTAFASVLIEKLIDRLVSIGISVRFLKVIVALLTNNRFSVVMNGRSGRFYPVNKGLGEGTGISPLLFIYIFFSSFCVAKFIH